jgi:hypothetical protein
MPGETGAFGNKHLLEMERVDFAFVFLFVINGFYFE